MVVDCESWRADSKINILISYFSEGTNVAIVHCGPCTNETDVEIIGKL